VLSDLEIHRRRARLLVRDRRWFFWAHMLFKEGGNYPVEALDILKLSI
jgi:hypothetical protein